jgi:hypothetical protein
LAALADVAPIPPALTPPAVEPPAASAPLRLAPAAAVEPVVALLPGSVLSSVLT